MKFWKSKSFWLLSVAVVCGLAAGLSAKRYIGEQLEIEKAKIAPKQQTVQVVVAKTDLRIGESVGEHNMAVRAVPADFVSSQSIRAERFDIVSGTKLAAPVRAGEMLLRSSVVGVDASTFSTKVRPGVRAITVMVDDVNSISGMLQPGDRIDLLFSTKNPLATTGVAAQLNGDVTIPFMHNVVVLATGKQVRPADDGKGTRQFTTVTIEADTLQSQRLVVAQRAGKLTALLRNPDDHEPLQGGAMDLARLMDIRATKRTVMPAAALAQVIVGGQRQAQAAPSLVGAMPHIPPKIVPGSLSEESTIAPAASAVVRSKKTEEISQ
jgi:pilus assembly protein CpaB